MSAFYLTFVAVLLAGIGARDQVTVAGLALHQRRRPGLLVVALLAAFLTAAFAAFAAAVMLQELPSPARTIFAAIALGLAGLESMVLVPRRNPEEPTSSLGATLLVLLFHQATDAARFIVFGMGVGFAGPWPAGIAGALGGAGLVSFAWAFPEWLGTLLARWIRRVVGALLTCVALAMFLSEFGLL